VFFVFLLWSKFQDRVSPVMFLVPLEITLGEEGCIDFVSKLFLFLFYKNVVATQGILNCLFVLFVIVRSLELCVSLLCSWYCLKTLYKVVCVNFVLWHLDIWCKSYGCLSYFWILNYPKLWIFSTMSLDCIIGIIEKLSIKRSAQTLFCGVLDI